MGLYIKVHGIAFYTYVTYTLAVLSLMIAKEQYWWKKYSNCLKRLQTHSKKMAAPFSD